MVHVEWVYVQTAVRLSFSFCLKKGSYGRTKSNCFLCHLGAGDLKLMCKLWRGLDIGCWRMDVTFCFVDNSWHVQSWSGKRLSCSSPAVLVSHWGRPLHVDCLCWLFWLKICKKMRKNGKGRAGVRGLNIQPKGGALEAVSNVQEDAGEINSWGKDAGMQRAIVAERRAQRVHCCLSGYSCWVIYLISVLQRKNSTLSHQGQIVELKAETGSHINVFMVVI